MSAADRWLRFAEEDLRMAELAREDGIHAQACFHAQQVAEKVLKGYLKGRGRQVPRTHSIVDLARLAAKEKLPRGLARRLSALDAFYLTTRYPDAVPSEKDRPGRGEADEALDLAREVLRWASKGSNL
ncbi:MAG: HEPN domain-containing protein [Candidatus Bipolaricaulota bacterium]